MATRLNDQVEGIRSRFPSLQENRPTIVNAAFNELAWMREVIDGVSDFVAVISLNFVNSPKCIPIAFPKVDVRPTHRHLVLRDAHLR